MRVILLGPPGAGKGTIAKLIKDALGIMHVSTGDIFREEMNKNTQLGRDIKKYVESGSLVPDEVVTRIIENRLTTDQRLSKGYMLDGFPRTKTQAEDLDRILAKINKPLDYVFYMQATLPVITPRLTGRRVCKQCGALYHMTNKPPKVEGRCDECGGELYQRADDNKETIKKRMDVYLKNTAPIIEYYTSQGRLTKIDADLDAQQIKDQLMRTFDEHGRFDQNKIAEGN